MKDRVYCEDCKYWPDGYRVTDPKETPIKRKSYGKCSPFDQNIEWNCAYYKPTLFKRVGDWWSIIANENVL